MRYRQLTGTDLTCSVLGLGTWAFGGPNTIAGTAVGWRALADADVHATIRAAIHSGVTFFDTSDMYGQGRAEELLGDALGEESQKVIVATKGGLLPAFRPGTTDIARDFSGRYLKGAVDRSLKRLRRERIDLYQLHGPDLSIQHSDDTWGTLQDLQAEGKIWHFGVSLGSKASDVTLWHQRGVVAIQARYNVAHIEEARAIDANPVLGRSIIARSVLEHGFLTGRYRAATDFPAVDHRQRKLTPAVASAIDAFEEHLCKTKLNQRYSMTEAAVCYVLGSPKVAVALIGATSSEQVHRNTRIVEELVLNASDREEISQIANRVFVGASI